MSTSELPHLLDQVTPEHLRQHIQALQGIRHPVVAPQALEMVAAYIQSTLEKMNYAVGLHPFPFEDQIYHNILATSQGALYPSERILVTAHFDSEPDTPGADDNASGVAAVLELARIFQHTTFERTVQFVAFNLEERQRGDVHLENWLYGSRALAAHARAESWNILGLINLETIAYAGKDIAQSQPEGLPFKIPSIGNFIAVVGNQFSAGLVTGYAQAIVQHHLDLPAIPLIVPGNGEILPDTRRSDHAPFWDAGYAAIMLTDTANFRTPHYHKPTDTLETLNLEFCANVCRAVGGLLAGLAGIQDFGSRQP